MRRVLNILFFLGVGLFLLHPEALHAQNEGSIEIEARILPATSGTVNEGTSSSSSSSTSVSTQEDAETGTQAATDETGAAQTTEEGETSQAAQTDGSTPQQATNSMTVSSRNSVLVEVEKSQQLFLRRLMNFEDEVRQGEIDVGSLEESTTVDIIHVTL